MIKQKVVSRLILLKGALLVLGSIIILFSIKQRRLPKGILEWLIWGLDALIIITEVF